MAVLKIHKEFKKEVCAKSLANVNDNNGSGREGLNLREILKQNRPAFMNKCVCVCVYLVC